MRKSTLLRQQKKIVYTVIQSSHKPRSLSSDRDNNNSINNNDFNVSTINLNTNTSVYFSSLKISLPPDCVKR